MTEKLSHEVLPGGLSEEDHDKIFELASHGLKARAIARKLRKHPSTVAWFMYRTGLKVPRYASRAFMRCGRLVKPFTPEEDAFIVARRLEGLGPTAIARMATERFGHPRNMWTIANRLTMLAARDEVLEAAE